MGSHDPRGIGRRPRPAPEILISHNAGYVRNNATTAKAAILTANGNEHNLADTLGHVMAIGAKEMRADQPWVEAALHAGGISPVPDDRLVFQAALGGLLTSSELACPTRRVLLRDRRGHVHPSGLAIRNAVGFAMPRAGLPRDSSHFSNAKSFGSLRKPWQKDFCKAFTQRTAAQEATSERSTARPRGARRADRGQRGGNR